MRNRVSRPSLILAFLALLGMLLPAAIEAQVGTGNVEVRFAGEPDAANFPTVTARVTVLDPKGIPVPNLDTPAFEVFEDGQSVPVSKVEPQVNQDVRIAVVLPIDLSGTMFEEIEDAKAQAISFVNGLGPNDKVAVLGFVDKVDLGEPFPAIDPTREIGFTTDKQAVVGLINSLGVPDKNKGDTPLYDALFKAVRMAEQVTGVDYRFVMPFTDGKQDCLKRPQDCLMTADQPYVKAMTAGIPIFPIGLGQGADESYLKQVAQMTGGLYNYAPTPDTLSAIYRSVTDQLKQQYVVTYKAKAAADGRTHQLGVKVSVPQGEGSNVAGIQYPCPTKPGIRLFYLKPSAVAGAEPTEEPLEDGMAFPEATQLSIVPDISACNPIVKTELYVDGRFVRDAANAPFHLLVDLLLDTIPVGVHQFAVRAYDSAGNVSDDAVVSVSLGQAIQPTGVGTGATAPNQTTAIPPPTTPEPTGGCTERAGYVCLLGRSVPTWVLAAAGLLLLVLVLAMILLLTRRKARVCSICGRRMDPSWNECMFCADGTTTQSGRGGVLDEDETAPEQPVVGEGGDWTAPDLQPVGGTVAPRSASGLGPDLRPPAREQAPATEVIRRLPKRMGYLVVERGERAGKEYQLHQGDTSIGRAGDSDIVLGDPSVGRQQAKVRLEADGFYVVDMAATNPTLVNGRPVSRQRLVAGDRLQLGNTTLVFKEFQTG